MKSKLALPLIVTAFVLVLLGVSAYAQGISLTAQQAATATITARGIDLGDGRQLIASNMEIKVSAPYIGGDKGSHADEFNHQVETFVTQEVYSFTASVQAMHGMTLPVGMHSSLWISHTVTAADHSLVSVYLYTEEYHAGAAHPGHHTWALNYDLETGKVLALTDLFKPDSRYLDVIADYCIAELKKRDALQFEEGAAPKPENYRNWNIAREGLLITFDEYQVAPYAAGPQRVTVPYATLHDIIDPDGPLARFSPQPEPHPPVVQIIAPADDAEYSVGQVVRVQFTAGDQSGLTRAELYVDGSQVKSKDYAGLPKHLSNDSLEWTAAGVGKHALKVIVYDPSDNASAPATRDIVVKHNATVPTVHIDYPTKRVVIVARQHIQIKATVNDEVGIKGLDLVERKDGKEIVYTNDPDRHGTPYHWSVWWQSAETGDHTLFVRAHDVNGGVGQSDDFVIGVTDDDPPRVQPSYSATSLSPGSNLKVHVEAVDSKGVKEMRLYVDGNVVDTWFAPDPSVGQSHASVDLWWRNVGPAGKYTAHVWAQDTLNEEAESPSQIIHVADEPPTPTPTPTHTPKPPTPTPTHTPTPKPAAPTAKILQPHNGFRSVLPKAVYFKVEATGSVRLDKVELWGYAQGQPTHQLLQTWPAGHHKFSGEYDWIPPNAGVFFFYVRAHDTAGQYGQSAQITGYIDPPSPPTPEPTHAIIGNWGAQTEDGGDAFVLSITDKHASGRLKGTLTIRPAQGQPQTAEFSHDSKIEEHHATIHAQEGTVTYTFTLTLSSDKQRLTGQWSTSEGAPQQLITFNRLLTE